MRRESGGFFWSWNEIQEHLLCILISPLCFKRESFHIRLKVCITKYIFRHPYKFLSYQDQVGSYKNMLELPDNRLYLYRQDSSVNRVLLTIVGIYQCQSCPTTWWCYIPAYLPLYWFQSPTIEEPHFQTSKVAIPIHKRTFLSDSYAV